MCNTEWTTLRQFNTKKFSVLLQCQEDEGAFIMRKHPVLGFDASTIAEMEAGERMPYMFRVLVLWGGHEIGCDHLGASVWNDPAEFQYLGGYFPDMLRAAIAEARHTLAHVPKLRIA